MARGADRVKPDGPLSTMEWNDRQIPPFIRCNRTLRKDKEEWNAD